MKTDEFAFGQFRLDRANALLWRGPDRVPLPPKPFEVLCVLVSRRGELVTKDELLDAVWSGVNVSDSSLTVALTALRAALGDDRSAPTYIETVTRRGYRFIAPVSPAGAARPHERDASSHAGQGGRNPSLRVGRATPLKILQDVLRRALEGRRQLVFITGEAGIGKTTFVDLAMEQIRLDDMGVLHCGCNELFGTHEAFLPLIEALHDVVRGDAGASVLASLREHAPTWLAQLPSLLRDEDRSVLHRETFGATRERMLREFCEFIEALAAERPWVIVLEDLHWSDVATVDALSRLSHREREAAILVLAVYRSTDAAAEAHPIQKVHRELQFRGRCTEIALEKLSRDEVEHYLSLRFGGTSAAELTDRVFGRTGGQPLFVVSLVDHLIAQGALVQTGEEWRLAEQASLPRDSLPHDLREMILRQIARLGADEKALLEVASAAGANFSALLVAGALNRDVVEVERIFEDLARLGRFVTSVGVEEWPNGTVSGAYAFVHALYPEVLSRQIAPARRSSIHRKIGESLERGRGSRADEHASALALHFELGRDAAKALRYLGLAAEISARRFGAREAVGYLTRALDLVTLAPAEAQSEARLKLYLQRAWVARAGGDFVSAMQDLDAMVREAAAAGNLREEVNARVNLSRFHLQLDRRQSLSLAQEAVERSRATDDPAIKALAQGNLANLRLMLGRWSDRDAETCRKVIALIDDAQDLSARLRRCAMEMVLDFLRSDYASCCESSRRGRQLTHAVGDVYLFAMYNTMEAFSRLYLGQWGEVRELARSALAIAERNENAQAGLLCRLTDAWLYLEAQDFETAARRARATLDPGAETNAIGFFMGRTLLARASIGLGDLPGARAHIEAIERRSESDGAMESTIIPHYFLSRSDYWLAFGDLEKAREEAARLREWTALAPDRQFLALSHEATARIELASGVFAAAAAHLARAITLVRKAGLPLAAWRIYATAARYRQSRHEPEKAANFLRRRDRQAASLTASLHSADELRSSPLFARADKSASRTP